MNARNPNKILSALVAALCAMAFGAVAQAKVPGSTQVLVDLEPSVLEKCELGPVKSPLIVDLADAATPEPNIFDRLAVCVMSGEAVDRQLVIAPEWVNERDEALAMSMALWMASLGLDGDQYEVLGSNKVHPAPAIKTPYATRRIAMRIIDADTVAGNGEMVVKMGERLVDFCALGQFNVFFETGSAALSNEARRDLNRVAACIREGEIKAEGLIVTGHASPLGDAEANRKLSDARAHSVSVYLIGAGVPETALSTVAFGEVAERDYLAPSAERRVDIIVAGR